MLQDDEKYLEALIRAGRMGPDAEQVDRLERRVEPSFATAEQSKSRVGGLGEHASRLKWVVAFVAIGLVGSTTVSRGFGTREEGARPMAKRTPMRMSMPAPSVVTTESPSVAEPPTPIALPEPRAPGRNHEGAKRHLEVAPPARSQSQEVTTIEAPAPAVPAEPPEPSSPAAESIPAQAPAIQSGESEVAYLRRAQAAMASNPQRALALAEDHPSRFPNAVLVQEREVIAIDALVKLRRMSEARARIAAFRARFPQSAHLAHVLSAAGDAP